MKIKKHKREQQTKKELTRLIMFNKRLKNIIKKQNNDFNNSNTTN